MMLFKFMSSKQNGMNFVTKVPKSLTDLLLSQHYSLLKRINQCVLKLI
jgi:hypothetical protein